MKNKIIIVTGGASGIGLATAKKLSIDNNVIIQITIRFLISILTFLFISSLSNYVLGELLFYIN